VISIIPEGDDYELFGWNKPVFNKVSTSRALTFSWLMPNLRIVMEHITKRSKGHSFRDYILPILPFKSYFLIRIVEKHISWSINPQCFLQHPIKVIKIKYLLLSKFIYILHLFQFFLKYFLNLRISLEMIE
jgi:hypothetical protein